MDPTLMAFAIGTLSLAAVFVKTGGDRLHDDKIGSEIFFTIRSWFNLRERFGSFWDF